MVANSVGSKRAFKSLIALAVAPLLIASTLAVSPISASAQPSSRLPATQGSTQRVIIAVATDADVAGIAVKPVLTGLNGLPEQGLPARQFNCVEMTAIEIDTGVAVGGIDRRAPIAVTGADVADGFASPMPIQAAGWVIPIAARLHWRVIDRLVLLQFLNRELTAVHIHAGLRCGRWRYVFLLLGLLLRWLRCRLFARLARAFFGGRRG